MWDVHSNLLIDIYISKNLFCFFRTYLQRTSFGCCYKLSNLFLSTTMYFTIIFCMYFCFVNKTLLERFFSERTDLFISTITCAIWSCWFGKYCRAIFLFLCWIPALLLKLLFYGFLERGSWLNLKTLFRCWILCSGSMVD